MISVIVGGAEVPYLSISVAESVFQYTTVVSVVSPVPFSTDRFEISFDNDKLKFVVIEEERNGATAFIIKAYPADFFDMLNTTYESFVGVATTKELTEKIGLPVEFEEGKEGDPAFWVLPKYKLRNIIDRIQKGTIINNGGLPLVHADMNGRLLLQDIMTASKKTGVFFGYMEKVAVSSQYIQRVPGSAHFVFYSEKSFEEEDVVIEKGLGTATICCFADTPEEKEYQINQYRWNYYMSKVKAMTMCFTGVDALYGSVGDLIQHQSTGMWYVLLEATYTLSGDKLIGSYNVVEQSGISL